MSNWIGLDWGTTHLRAWLMDGPDMLDERVSDDGMAQLQGDGFSSALSAICTVWPDVPVVACGMVGARQGWFMELGQ